MGVAAEDDVDTADAARKLEIDIHAVMRQQHHGIDLVIVSQRVDEFLQFVIADPERPVRRKSLRVCDRHIGKCLSDHGDAVAADLLDHGRLEHASRCRIVCFGIVERRFVGEKDVLRQKFALEALKVAAKRLFAIGEFPVAGHRLDAEQVRGFDHVGALHGVGKPGALPQIAAIEQQRAFGSGVAAQALDQRLQMREAAELAEAGRGFLEIETAEGVGVGTVGPDAKSIEKGAADQMRWFSLHRADPEIDARFANIHRQQLRVRVG